LKNELTNHLKIIHCYDVESSIPKKLKDNVLLLDIIYPKLKIDVVFMKAKFGPSLVEFLSQRLGIQKNFMFIACPSTGFPHNFGDLGGVRLITH